MRTALPPLLSVLLLVTGACALAQDDWRACTVSEEIGDGLWHWQCGEISVYVGIEEPSEGIIRIRVKPGPVEARLPLSTSSEMR